MARRHNEITVDRQTGRSDPEWEVIGGQQMSDEAIVKLAKLLLGAMADDVVHDQDRGGELEAIHGSSEGSA